MKDHPNCRYSMSSQKECTSTNGDYACETIRRVFRNCPGLTPKQVYDVTTRDTGTVAKSPGGDGGDGGSGGMPIPGVRHPQRGWGAPAAATPDDWPGGGPAVDDLFGSLHDRLNNFFKDMPFPPFPGAEAGTSHHHGGRTGAGDDTSGDASYLPHVPPPHKGQQQSQSPPKPGQKPPDTGEGGKGGSVVARA
ncbi:unnamed protein product [Hapterophycus canaliculatus]